MLRARGQVVHLDPRIGAPGTWWWCPNTTPCASSNVLTLLGSLNPVDDDWLAWGRAAFAGFSTLPGPRTALLVGGPTPLAPWDETAMVGVFQALAEQIRSEGGSLLATTSRRTHRRWRRSCARNSPTCRT